MPPYPETLSGLQKELSTHAEDGRSDDLFRFVIMHAQVGKLAVHLSHDQKHNPVARPHASKNSEENDFGHAVIQLITYGILRGFDAQRAVNTALDNIRDKDFMKKEAAMGCCKGVVVARPIMFGQNGWEPDIMLSGKAFVDLECSHLTDAPPLSILITNHPDAGVTAYAHRFIGMITDNGGISCHAAIVSRELHIPCIVGTGNVTTLFNTGDVISLHSDGRVTRNRDGGK